MKRGDRYDTADLEEDQREPGSRGPVLKNLLGITSKREMDRVEAREQVRALQKLITLYGPAHRFTAADVRRIHKLWLDPIYSWAGQYRRVQLGKDNFPFASAGQIPRLMDEFERGPLRSYTPCKVRPKNEIAEALAIVHAELELIHPFREGNGRVGRMLAALMGLQAGLPSLFFGDIKGQKRQKYFTAVRAGLEQNYEPMQRIFSDVIERTLQIHGGT
ncbi:MAG: Fic family protein [Burkholderiaceae bacterium]|nr:Fic family protein [Burkholderiaceae bacterium]